MAIGKRDVLPALGWALGLIWLGALTACGVSYPYSGELMPTPLYKESASETDESLLDGEPARLNILYATDRKPAGEGDDEPSYLNARGDVVRLGICPVSVSDSRPDGTIEVGKAEELGVLPQSTSWLMRDVYDGKSAERYWSILNEKLARSGSKEITVYVPGFKVVFEDPVMVAAEFLHLTRSQGAVVAYSWPAKPTMWAYFGDIESTRIATWSLRHFLVALAEKTDAEHINIVGYSAGTRVVLGALRDLRLMHHGESREEIRAATKLRNVLLIGSDVDREVFGVYYSEGLNDDMETLTLYVSKADFALSVSQFLFNRDRLGDATRIYSPEAREYLRNNDGLVVIDVTNAQGSQKGNGHGYFRNSPWVSNDLLFLLGTNLPPAERGLVRNPETNVWEFPPNYPERIEELVMELGISTAE